MTMLLVTAAAVLMVGVTATEQKRTERAWMGCIAIVIVTGLSLMAQSGQYCP